MKKENLLYAYILFCLVYLTLTLFEYENFAWFLKPFLLPFLFGMVWKSKSFPTKKILLTALTFSWMGDVILMFTNQGEIYFILGLVAFLISHLFYIALFLKQDHPTNGVRSPLFWLSLLVVGLYLRSMLVLLFPTLGALKLPVTVYAATISIMLIVAFKGYLSWSGTAKYAVLVGAVFFVVSDSLLAIDKFHEPLPLATFGIMLTYLLAQSLITTGILKLNAKK